jgi:hypothetical protein
MIAPMTDIPRLSELTSAEYRKHAVADAMRLLSCASFGAGTTSAELAAKSFIERWPRALTSARLKKDLDDGLFVMKAATPPGTTTTLSGLLPPALLGPLVQRMQAETVLAKIPGLQAAPLNVPIPDVSTPPIVKWVGQNIPKPGTLVTTTAATLPPTKCAAILALSEELVRLVGPDAENLMAAVLVDATTRFVDTAFLGNAAAVANTSPAGILNGVVATAAAPTLAGNVGAVLAALFAGRPATKTPVLVMSPAVAGTLGATGAFPNLPASAAGVPVAVSVGAAQSLIAIDAAAIVYHDDGAEIDRSREAAIYLDTAPVGDASGVLTDLWSLNLRGFRVDRFVSWLKVAANAAAFVVVP